MCVMYIASFMHTQKEYPCQPGMKASPTQNKGQFVLT